MLSAEAAVVCVTLSSDILFLKHDSSIFRQSSNPVCGFSMMEQVRLCAVNPLENWLGSSMNHIQGSTTVRESYSPALEQVHLLAPLLSLLPCFRSPRADCAIKPSPWWSMSIFAMPSEIRQCKQSPKTLFTNYRTRKNIPTRFR